MSSYSIFYSIDSKEMYRGHEDAIVTSDVVDAFSFIDLLGKDDTLYVCLIDTKDAININGDDGGGIFLEVNTVKGGVFSKDMSINEIKDFLVNLTVNFDELDALGFESSSI